MAITDTQIETLANGILTATRDLSTGRTSYLRTLITAAQDELGRKRGQDTDVQLAALGRAHERFYVIVLKAAEQFVPKHTKDRAVELHRRANFARTAMGAVRRHVRAGGDLAMLAAAKTTKAVLEANVAVREMTPARLKHRAETQTKALTATLIGLAESDRDAALALIAQLQHALGVGRPARARVLPGRTHVETHVGVQ